MPWPNMILLSWVFPPLQFMDDSSTKRDEALAKISDIRRGVSRQFGSEFSKKASYYKPGKNKSGLKICGRQGLLTAASSQSLWALASVWDFKCFSINGAEIERGFW